MATTALQTSVAAHQEWSLRGVPALVLYTDIMHIMD